MKMVAIVASASPAHRRLATGALQKTAEILGHEILVESDDTGGATGMVGAEHIGTADVVILVAEGAIDTSRFEGKRIIETSVSRAIRETDEVIATAVGEAARSAGAGEPQPGGATLTPQPTGEAGVSGKLLVGITSCPTGIAHTFMAAEALQKAARSLGHTIKIETQGSVGAKNQLREEEIEAADAVVIAAETRVDTSRFAGKPVYVTSTKQAMQAGREVIERALEQPPVGELGSGRSSAGERPRPERTAAGTGAYKHLMTGVSYMLPVVIAGGLAIALAFALGGIYAGEQEGTLAWALSQIGGGTAFQLFVAVLSAFIAFSIADRPGIAPGLVGGMLAHNLEAGFLGGIASGFLAGYLTRFLAERIRLPTMLEGLKPVLILPFVATLVVGLLMIYVIAPPVQVLNTVMTEWLVSLSGAHAALLGLILGSMMAFDMGGPLNKAAYTFAVGLLASQIYTPMAAVMAAGMTPPLGLAVAVLLFRRRFDLEEREAGGPAAVLGLSFITEGAIPFAAKDPLRVIPALMLGSAVAGALSMVAGVQLLVPHGGIFAVVIPGAVTNLLPYLFAIAAGTLVTAGALFMLKRRLPVAPRAAAAEQVVAAS
jgi:fructose PTS system EIIBC or EIIC component